MNPIITKFNDKTGDFEILISNPYKAGDISIYTEVDSIYEIREDYNCFDLIKKNQELKEVIDKAIKYIKDNEISLYEQKVYYYEKDIKLINIPSDDILNILKEVE